MNDVNAATDVSSILDDANPGRLAAAYRGIEAVHASLLDKRSLTWSRPAAGLSERVMLRASLHRPQRVRRWPVPLAASLFLAGSMALVLLRVSHHWSGQASPSPIAAAPHPEPVKVIPTKVILPPPNIDPGILTRMAERSEPAFASIEQPMLGQVRAVGLDAQRGFRAVLTRLPIRVSMDVLKLL